MTKKDYELIASAFNEQIEHLDLWKTDSRVSEQGREFYEWQYRAVRSMALELSEKLKRENPRFNEDRFLQACGFTDN